MINQLSVATKNWDYTGSIVFVSTVAVLSSFCTIKLSVLYIAVVLTAACYTFY